MHEITAIEKAEAQKAVGVTIRLVPLKTAHKVIGVLRLLIDDVRWPSSENMLGVGHDTYEALFFSTFLEQAVTVIERESDRLNRLVENLLDISRIEGGALHPKIVWYPWMS